MSTLQDYRERPHWSYSALNQFVNICSLQYAFERVYKTVRAFTPVSLSFGNAFHRACEYVNLIRLEGKQPNRREAMEVFGSLWGRQVQDDGDIRFDEDQNAAECARLGRDMVGCYVDHMDPEEQVLAVNEAFAVPLVDRQGQVLETPMIGEIDLVVEKAGIGKQLVDMKSAARRWPKGKADQDLQPTVFCYGYRQLHGAVPGFRFDVIVKNKTPVYEPHVTERGEDQFNRMVALVQMADRMIASEHFLPNEQGFYCGSCPHQEACKAWHRQAARVTVRMAA